MDNVSRNHLGSRIRVVLVEDNADIIPGGRLEPGVTYDFVMCNPPFYSSLSQMRSLQEAKRMPAYSVRAIFLCGVLLGDRI